MSWITLLYFQKPKMLSRGKRITQLALSHQQVDEDVTSTSSKYNESSNCNQNNILVPTNTSSTEGATIITTNNDIGKSSADLQIASAKCSAINDNLSVDKGLSSLSSDQNFPVLTAVEVVPYHIVYDDNVEVTFEDCLKNPAEELAGDELVLLESAITETAVSTESAPPLVNDDENDKLNTSATSHIIEEAVDDPDLQLTGSEFDLDSDLIPSSDDGDEEAKKSIDNRKRGRKADKEEWSRQKTKARRMTGQDYIGYTRNKEGEISHNKERDARKMGPSCNSVKCLKYKNRFCNSISEEQRKVIFKKFWEEMSWDQKKIYVTGLMEVKPTGRKYVENSRRNITYNYFLKIGNERKQVCKAMFLSTMGLREWMVTNWCQKTVSGILPAAEVQNSIRKLNQEDSDRKIKTEQQDQYLKKFLEDLPKMPSHYCRKDSNKQYLEFNFESKANLYKLYKEKCIAEQKSPLSSWYFSETFEKLNLAIFIPKKDQCNTCVAFKAGNVEDVPYNRHISLKDLARKHKDADTIKSKENSCHVFVMDVQAVKMCPVNNANKFYFKTRLKVHNFTIYSLKNHECCNYWWSEIEGNLCSSVFATIVIDHLHKYCQDELPIIIWSDGCSYQNRNTVLSNALLQYAVQQKKTITQKYLEPGHTQMQCDAVHSLIERKLKNKEIVMPYDYVRLTREARQKPSPLLAHDMTHDKFRNYDDNNLMRYKSIRPGRSKNDPTVNDLREIHYFPNGKIGYKTHFDEEITELPQRTKEVAPHVEPSQLFRSQLKITKQKYDHLQEIKTTLPPEYHGFYDSLEYE